MHTFQKQFLWCFSNRSPCHNFCTQMVFLQYGSCKRFAVKLTILSHFPKTVFVKFCHNFPKAVFVKLQQQRFCYNICTFMVSSSMCPVKYLPWNWPFLNIFQNVFVVLQQQKSLLQLLHSCGFSPVWFLWNICNQIGHYFTLSI